MTQMPGAPVPDATMTQVPEAAVPGVGSHVQTVLGPIDARRILLIVATRRL
jgi:hypothetical protein